MATFEKIYPWAGDEQSRSVGRELDKVYENVSGVSTVADGALQAANNLSDLSSVPAARTALGLVAGGAGDIWVEKAGDTMTNTLTISSGKLLVGSGTSSTSYLSTGIDRVTSSGDAVLFVDSTPSDGSSAAVVRIFRNTNTTGGRAVQIFKGDGSTTVQHKLSSDGTSTYFCADNGNCGVGNSSPSEKLHVTGNIKLSGLLNFPKTSSTGAPSTTEYPKSGDFGVHEDTTLGVLYFVYNNGGVILKALMS